MRPRRTHAQTRASRIRVSRLPSLRVVLTRVSQPRLIAVASSNTRALKGRDDKRERASLPKPWHNRTQRRICVVVTLCGVRVFLAGFCSQSCPLLAPRCLPTDGASRAAVNSPLPPAVPRLLWPKSKKKKKKICNITESLRNFSSPLWLQLLSKLFFFLVFFVFSCHEDYRGGGGKSNGYVIETLK